MKSTYAGFEQGPIRPPSESASLLIRVTRNCPWNRCTFCPVYKGAKFSLRPVDHVLRDIDAVSRQVTVLHNHLEVHGQISYRDLNRFADGFDEGDRTALYAAYSWLDGGMQSIFLQDANSLVIKPDDLILILDHIHESFPWVERITSYARSQTIDRISEVALARISVAGLNRIHIGLESGADDVLQLVQKGTDQAMHIRAGQKVKASGMELSEYVMPG
ncbi:MAG: radical SAM protein, partial [Desulfuromusa sp.]|nr:radical SAM protein [Desulfuromusa sp.]